MIRIFKTDLDQFVNVENPLGWTVDDTMVWFDLDHPTPAEEAWLEESLGIELPTREDMKDIEPSSRLYREHGATYMTANLLWRVETDVPETTPVAFVLVRGRLVTIRYAEPKAFVAFQLYAARNATVCSSGAATMLGLLDAIIDRTAEVLEQASAEVEAISQTIGARRLYSTSPKNKGPRTSDELENHLGAIVACQNLSAKIRDSMMTLSRVVSFLPLSKEFEKNNDLREHLVSLGHDVQSLMDHTAYLNSTLSFLLDAALGLINIEQNAIIKIFSIAAVVFLPPTLVASVYGMNFTHMPELGWVHGYPFALFLMMLSAIGPYYFFKRKGWL